MKRFGGKDFMQFAQKNSKESQSYNFSKRKSQKQRKIQFLTLGIHTQFELGIRFSIIKQIQVKLKWNSRCDEY